MGKPEVERALGGRSHGREPYGAHSDWGRVVRTRHTSKNKGGTSGKHRGAATVKRGEGHVKNRTLVNQAVGHPGVYKSSH